MGAQTLDTEVAAVRRRVLIALHASNLLGAALAVVFLAVVAPYPIGLIDGPDGALERNLSVCAVCIVLGTIYATFWDRRWFASVQGGDALRGPRALMIPCAQIWGSAALIFTALNLSYSWRLALSAATTIVLSGMITGALSYLLAERLLR